MLNLDTHVLVRAMVDEISTKERKLLAGARWGISAIVLWELAKLAQLGSVEIDLEASEVRRFLAAVHVWPLTLDIARTSTRLDFRSDPADELIAATSIVERVPLVTRDRVIRRSRLVPLARA
ncbi:MAG: PIN domain-containing protein [Deltaproteobacteria bacterium]|nr:PIN domain-containing protein [Deltaproteobacteria bacterium]